MNRSKTSFRVLGLVLVLLLCAKDVVAKSKIITTDQQTILSSSVKHLSRFLAKGRVCDSFHQPVIGASVSIANTDRGTLTDSEGNFSIQVSPGEILRVSCIGFKTQTLLLKSVTDHYSICLESNDKLLNAVVVTALGIKREERALSYDVGKINSKSINTVKSVNFMNSLNGKVAGLNVTASGSAGGAAEVILRGVKSINGNSRPLYVIDGIPIKNISGQSLKGLKFAGQASEGDVISDLNPEDIESISVLTGTSAAALYGSTAANGAILITTKKGKAGKPTVNISYSSTFSKPFVMPKFQDTYRNRQGEFASWGDRLPQASGFTPDDFYQTGFNSTASGSISMGNKHNQTYISIGSTNASGIVHNNTYNRYNLTIRNSSQLYHDKLTIDAGAQLIFQNNQNMLSEGFDFNPIPAVYMFPRGEDFDATRTFETFDQDRYIMQQNWKYGDQGLHMQNPYWSMNRDIHHNKKERHMISLGLKYKATDWLNFTARGRSDDRVSDWEKKLYATTIGQFADEDGYYGSTKEEIRQTYLDVMANINKQFADFSLVANIGGSYYDDFKNKSGFQGQLSQIPNFFTGYNVDFNAHNSGIIQKNYHKQTQSVFANLELGYKHMLYLTLTGRNDWASTLANTGNDSFFYPSVGLSALVSQMVRLPRWINYFKVRGAYSSVGSAPSTYITIPTYPYSKDNKGGLPKTITTGDIMDLKPENTKSYEGGFDFRFLDDHLLLSATIYKSDTYHQTFNVPRSASSGYPNLYIQSGDVSNWGIEASLGYHSMFGKLSWDTGLTFSMNRNKVIALAKNYYDPLTQTYGSIDRVVLGSEGTFRNMLIVGGSVGDMYTTSVLKTDAKGQLVINSETGQPEVQKLDGNFKRIGNTTPRANIGFRNGFSYGPVDFEFVITARLGGQVVSETQAYLDAYGVSAASAEARNNGGVRIGSQTLDAQAYYQTIGGSEALVDHYVYSATNVRLQELSIGYTFPQKWFKHVKTSLAFVGQNLFMIYNKAPFDPESVASMDSKFRGVDYFMLPTTRNLGFSLRMQF